MGTRCGWGWDKSLIPVGFGYGDGDEFFLRGWVWDNETRLRPIAIPRQHHFTAYTTQGRQQLKNHSLS